MTDNGLLDRLSALEADNARLRRLLDEAGTPDGPRDAFRGTVAMLRAILRRSAETAADVETFAAHLDGRLDALARTRLRLDTFGEADLHTLIADELAVHLVHEGERATLDGPEIRLLPKAAQILGLAVHELASNAVEHGTLGGPEGRVAVRWRSEPAGAEPILALAWTEAGGAGRRGPARRGFGLAAVEEMLPYEIGAATALAFEPDGLRCTLRIPLTASVGRVVAEP